MQQPAHSPQSRLAAIVPNGAPAPTGAEQPTALLAFSDLRELYLLLRRRLRLLATITAGVAAFALVLAFVLPNRYSAETVIMLDPRKTRVTSMEVVSGLTPDVAELYPAELSGGMQKRVGLARAIAEEPEIIFFDEPTTGLDPIMAGVINELNREIVTEMGATAMTITHDMSSVRAIADRVAMLHAGVIQWTGPVGEMDATPDPYVQQFICGRAEGPIAAVR
jgi:ABC-type cobalamin/Fe3+-siderophores transport system ATPase subunit